MSMQSLNSFGFDRKIGFSPERSEGFLNPTAFHKLPASLRNQLCQVY